MKNTKWTTEKCEEIAKWCAGVKPYSEAAKHFDVDQATIRRCLRKVGAYESRAKLGYSEVELNLIQSMLDQGKTASQIAAATGRPVAGLHSLMRRVFAGRGASRGRPQKEMDTSKECIVTERGFGNSSKYLSDSSFMKVNL